MAIHPQEAGMEVMSALFAMVFGIPFLLLLIGSQKSQKVYERQAAQKGPLIDLMQEFVMSRDRSDMQAAKIHHILMTDFLQESEYQDLLTATGSFVPDGKPPYLNEEALSQVFCVFLAKRHHLHFDANKVEWVYSRQP